MNSTRQFLGRSAGPEFFHVVMLRSLDPVDGRTVELGALHGEKLDNNDDLVLLGFVELVPH